MVSERFEVTEFYITAATNCPVRIIGLCPSSGILEARKQFLEYQTMDKARKPGNSMLYTIVGTI
jgi:hypothetical protein